MAELKTKPSDDDVEAFIDSIEPERQDDCRAIMKIMADATGAPATMWGASMVGFDRYHYKYASGREGEWFITGFSPRKRDLTLYIMAGFTRYDALLEKLGPHKTGKSCLYVKRLDDLHLPTLKQLVKQSVAHMRKTYP